MPTTYKTQQVQGTAGVGTYATLYNTSASATAVVSTIAITNTASVSATYRIGIMGSAGTPAAANWLVYDSVVAGNDTIFLTVGISLGTSQFIRVSSSANTATFSAYVAEIT
jgi:glucose-6-phosphate dehydrogenase assembly protein OpcA